MASAGIESIAKEISSKLGGILAVRTYIGIADSAGNLIYAEKELEEYRNFISNFVKNNFKYLKVSEHSLPISRRNIMFFRLPKAMVVIYSTKGRVGQLLSFKSLLPKYMDSLDQLIPDASPEISTQPVILERTVAVPETIETIPGKIIERAVFSRQEAYYREIFPQLAKKIKEGAKFSLTTSVILNYSNGENSLADIFDKIEIEPDTFFEEFYKLYKAGWIRIPDYELFQVNCPTCKKSDMYKFVPIRFLRASPNGYLRFQLESSVCNHTCYVIVDKKQKVKSKAIPLLLPMMGEIDLEDLSIGKLIQFFGQDLFFNIFHAIFFKMSVLFLEEQGFTEKLIEFLRNFFPHISYQAEVQSISREHFIKMSKQFSDFLVIDLNSNIVINEPYESEDFDFELRLFKAILKEPKDMQILKTHAQFEHLILITDTILNEIEMYKEIKEDELIELMKKQNISIERSEIPIIKELADIYYGVDVRKKITKTLVGQVSDWLEGI
ncbi:MAG: hypothetical protein EU536_04685 [Promethearchaeota archaeon]|nr:MAG: hypothetical protein EU536_04685 [Candidatus Lokiarchaeota archaeon]